MPKTKIPQGPPPKHLRAIWTAADAAQAWEAAQKCETVRGAVAE